MSHQFFRKLSLYPALSKSIGNSRSRTKPESNFFGSFGFPLLILSVLIISPITEEVLFRYLIFKNLYKIYGLTPALLVSSLSFGLIHLHFGLGQSLAAITLGLFLAYLYQKTDSLLFIITIHLTANLANFFPDLPYSARKIGLTILGLCFCFSLFKVLKSN